MDAVNYLADMHMKKERESDEHRKSLPREYHYHAGRMDRLPVLGRRATEYPVINIPKTWGKSQALAAIMKIVARICLKQVFSGLKSTRMPTFRF